jgi:hypothetical protein
MICQKDIADFYVLLSAKYRRRRSLSFIRRLIMKNRNMNPSDWELKKALTADEEELRSLVYHPSHQVTLF